MSVFASGDDVEEAELSSENEEFEALYSSYSKYILEGPDRGAGRGGGAKGPGSGAKPTAPVSLVGPRPVASGLPTTV